MSSGCQLLSGSLPFRLRGLVNSQCGRRAFATTPSKRAEAGRNAGRKVQTHLAKHVIHKDSPIPEYPYGQASLYKQSDKGLYGGQRPRFGNNVSKRSETKTRRRWDPNVHSKALYSIALKKRVKLRLTSKVLKVIDREGGLDEYLLKESEARIKQLGPMGWALRWRLMQTPEVIKRFRTEAAAIGIPQDIIDQQWPTKPIASVAAREERRYRAAEAAWAAEELEEKRKRIGTLRTARTRLAKRSLELYKQERVEKRKNIANPSQRKGLIRKDLEIFESPFGRAKLQPEARAMLRRFRHVKSLTRDDDEARRYIELEDRGEFPDEEAKERFLAAGAARIWEQELKRRASIKKQRLAYHEEQARLEKEEQAKSENEAQA